MHTSIQQPSPAPGHRAQAAQIRRKARQVLAGNRMAFVLALLFLLTALVGVYMIADGLYMVGYLLWGSVLWLDIAAVVIAVLLVALLVIPLAASICRMACLMTACTLGSDSLQEQSDIHQRITPEQLFHPFTSRCAYGRAMAVGLESLGWALLTLGIPAVAYALLAQTFDSLANRGIHTTLCNLLTAASFLVCLGFGFLMFFLSGRRVGFGYWVFIHEELSLREVNRRFRSARRSFGRLLVLRISLVGWVALSVVGVLVPFVIHTIPYALCCHAVYAAELEKK